MNCVVKKPDTEGTVLQQPRSDHERPRRKTSILDPRTNRRTLFKKRAASKPPSLIIKLKNERFITAKNKVETIENNNFVTDSKKDDNGNFEQIDCCSVNEVLDVDEVACETCLVEETIVEHGCDDDVIIVQNLNSTIDVEDGGDKRQEVTEADLSTSQVHPNNDDVQILEDHTLDLLEQFVQDNLEAHFLVKHDLEKSLFGDLDSCLSELMPRARDLDTLEKEVWEGLDIFNRVDEIEARESMSVGNSFHTGNPNRKTRVRKVCGVKVLYDCKTCEGVFMTMGELLNHQEMIHAKVFSCGVCEKTFRKEVYLETHKDIHVCSICGVFKKFKGTICDSCKGKKKKSLSTPMKSAKKSLLSTPMKSSLGNSNIWKKKATANLSKFLFKSRSFRN